MIFKKKNLNVIKIYQNIVKISRSKFFYLDLNVEDTFEARFDLIIFHAFIIFYYFTVINESRSSISQELFDMMFEDFESNLREMGFGDIAVNKKMKLFITAFYGRIAQYSKGMKLYINKSDKKLLEQTILNNIYKGKSDNKKNISLFTDYMLKNINYFQSNSYSKNNESNYTFLNFF